MPSDVSVDRLAVRGVRMEVVVVVGECREEQSVCRRAPLDTVGFILIEGVCRYVGSGERTVAEPRPRRKLKCLIALVGGELGDLIERAVGHASRQEAQLQASTSTHCLESAERRTASVMRVARSPSSSIGSPSGLSPPIAA